MRDKIHSGAAWACLLGGVGLVFGGLVWGTFGRDHTKTVTKTVTLTKVVAKPAPAARWDGNVQTLANYLHPQRAAQLPCTKEIPKGSKCYGFLGPNYFATLAIKS